MQEYYRVPVITNPSVLSFKSESIKGSVLSTFTDEQEDILKLGTGGDQIQDIVAGLVENSEILDEKFYSLHNRENWIDKGFNIKPPRRERKQSDFDQQEIMFGEKSKKKNSKTPKSNKSKSKKRETVEIYKHNTFINHIETPSKSGILKIPADAQELYCTISKYKVITGIIEKHLKDKNNIFQKLLTIFKEYFMARYEQVTLVIKRKVSNSQIISDINKAIVDVQQLIRILYETLFVYYRMEKLKGGNVIGRENLFNRDNIINFITSIVIDEGIHRLLFDLMKCQEQDIEEIYDQNLMKCSKLQPQDFGVPNQFCLNELTVEYLKEKGHIAQHQQLTPIKSISSDFRSRQANNSAKSESSNAEEFKTLSELQQCRPFERSILMLSGLPTRRSPIHKLKTIVKAAELITTSIEEFYRALGLSNVKKLDADQTLSIFMFIVSQAGVHNIPTHCKIIEKFSTHNTLNSVSGYYATTLQACVDCICGMRLNEEHEDIEEIKKTVIHAVHTRSLLQQQAFEKTGQSSMVSMVTDEKMRSFANSMENDGKLSVNGGIDFEGK